MFIYILNIFNKAIQKTLTKSEWIKKLLRGNYLVSPKNKQWINMKERCEISKVNKSIGGNKRIGGTFCRKLIKE